MQSAVHTFTWPKGKPALRTSSASSEKTAMWSTTMDQHSAVLDLLKTFTVRNKVGGGGIWWGACLGLEEAALGPWPTRLSSTFDS